MRLADPVCLFLLLLIPVPWLFARRGPAVSWPTTGSFLQARKSRRWPARAPLAETFALAFLAFALARPQTIAGAARIPSKGVAIVVAIDRSSTMQSPVANDQEASPGASRLEAALAVFDAFVDARPDDLIGLVAFARLPERRAPLTVEHDFLADAADAIRPATAADDGTNMGDAIAWAIDDLQSAAPARKVVVLVSDGHNEPGVPGALDPIEAAALARSFGIVVHTIAIGESDPAGDISNRGPDVALLDHVARTSGGQSFVVNDVRRLENAFAQIDRLEKSPIEGEVQTRYREWRPLAAMLAAGCLTLGIVVRSIRKPILP